MPAVILLAVFAALRLAEANLLCLEDRQPSTNAATGCEHHGTEAECLKRRDQGVDLQHYALFQRTGPVNMGTILDSICGWSLTRIGAGKRKLHRLSSQTWYFNGVSDKQCRSKLDLEVMNVLAFANFGTCNRAVLGNGNTSPAAVPPNPPPSSTSGVVPAAATNLPCASIMAANACNKARILSGACRWMPVVGCVDLLHAQQAPFDPCGALTGPECVQEESCEWTDSVADGKATQVCSIAVPRTQGAKATPPKHSRRGGKARGAVAVTPKQHQRIQFSPVQCLGLNRRRCTKARAHGCVYKHGAYCDDGNAPLQFAICAEILWKNACRKVQPLSGSICRWSLGACDVKGLSTATHGAPPPPQGTKCRKLKLKTDKDCVAVDGCRWDSKRSKCAGKATGGL